MNGLKFPVLDDNKCYRYISCVMFFSVRYFKLFVIIQFGELYYLKHKTMKSIYKISTNVNHWFMANLWRP